jgi:ABC-type nitrate/sulfonate/bicarbonate transport system ATPase subunit
MQIKNLPKVCYRNAASGIIAGAHSEHVILKSIINIQVKNGKFIAIVGRPTTSGCDKSTLLNTTTGIDKLYSDTDSGGGCGNEISFHGKADDLLMITRVETYSSWKYKI